MFSLKLKKHGFTLIELLVVISLIAILSIAVLATIDPVEQRNKGRDTSIKQTAAEYLAAQERYYATYGCYTWNEPATGAPGQCTVSTGNPSTPTAVTNSNFGVGRLVSVGEVKQSLLNRLNTPAYSGIYLYMDSNKLLHMSFKPQSDSFGNKANYAVTGANGSNCSTTATPVPGTTWYCIPDTPE